MNIKDFLHLATRRAADFVRKFILGKFLALNPTPYLFEFTSRPER